MEHSFRDKSAEVKLFQRRAIVLAILIFIALAVLAWRMAYLQISLFEKYSNLSENNRIKFEPLPPKRGLILDRNGELLAENIPSYSLILTPERISDIDATIEQISELIEISERNLEQFEKRRSTRRKPFEPIVLKHKLSEEEIAKVLVNRLYLPGVDVEAQLVRHYPQGQTFAHVLGYVGRINQREQDLLDADTDNKRRYRATRHIGKQGIEQFYESVLHGEPGYQKVETNARGRVLRVVEEVKPTPGQDLILNLDSRLQRMAEQEMKNRRGAVVAIEVETGGILTLYSNPSFDPNLFVTGISHKDYNALRNNPDLPLFNRAIRGRYPPASTLKPFVGLAVADMGITSWSRSIDDKGVYMLPNDERLYRDWKREGHGKVNLERAVVESCDTYFYDVAVKTGIDRLSPFLGQFGFGRNMTADVHEAYAGLLPSKEWKQRRRRLPWFPGDTVNLGIGQGFMQATPLQLATATSVLASRGEWHQPSLLMNKEEGWPVREVTAIPDIELNNPKNWDRMFEAMRKVVSSIHGTARGLQRHLEHPIAGKTGTAQVVGIKQDEEYDSEALRERLRDHALFVSFSPVENPQIAVAVIVENGESAGRTAAPIAQKIINTYLGSGHGSH